MKKISPLLLVTCLLVTTLSLSFADTRYVKAVDSSFYNFLSAGMTHEQVMILTPTEAKVFADKLKSTAASDWTITALGVAASLMKIPYVGNATLGLALGVWGTNNIVKNQKASLVYDAAFRTSSQNKYVKIITAFTTYMDTGTKVCTSFSTTVVAKKYAFDVSELVRPNYTIDDVDYIYISSPTFSK